MDKLKIKKSFGLILICLAVFLMSDAVLAITIGKRYLYWGLDYMPAWYSSFMLRIYESPTGILWGLMLAELTIGFILFWISRKLIFNKVV